MDGNQRNHKLLELMNDLNKQHKERTGCTGRVSWADDFQNNAMRCLFCGKLERLEDRSA